MITIDIQFGTIKTRHNGESAYKIKNIDKIVQWLKWTQVDSVFLIFGKYIEDIMDLKSPTLFLFNKHFIISSTKVTINIFQNTTFFVILFFNCFGQI